MNQKNQSTTNRAAKGGAFLLMFTCFLVLLNVAIHFSAKSSQRNRLLKTISQMSRETGFIFLGNSLMEAGFDPQAFTNSSSLPSGPEAFALLALGGTSPVEHNLILRRALAQKTAVKCVVYGFFDDQLFSKSSGDWPDLVGNRALSCAFPDEAANYYDPDSFLKRWQLQATHAVPMLEERSSLWSKVEQLRRRFEDVGMPRHAVNRFGRVEDFSALEAADAASFSKRCENAIARGEGFSLPVSDMLSLCKAANAKLVLLEMPMPSRHRNLFYSTEAWRRLKNATESLAREKNCLYVPASDWILDDSLFEDATHLSPAGAAVFTGKLANELSMLVQGPGKPAQIAQISSTGFPAHADR